MSQSVLGAKKKKKKKKKQRNLGDDKSSVSLESVVSITPFSKSSDIISKQKSDS